MNCRLCHAELVRRIVAASKPGTGAASGPEPRRRAKVAGIAQSLPEGRLKGLKEGLKRLYKQMDLA